MMRLAALLLFLCVAGACLGATDTPAVPPTEDQRIEALLTQLAAQQDLRFIRNGSDYDAATAVKFLRGKWDRQRADIKTVHDFVEKVASKSSTTGQPYLIRLADGREVPCRDYVLARLESPATKTPTPRGR